MTPKILLTSFQPWLPHHTSNASDDLLQHLETASLSFARLVFLRRLPVETAIASETTIQAIALQRPDVVVCCGMAEKRDRLTVESQAFAGEQRQQTPLDLIALTAALRFTDVSHDAGKFVCEGLYFQVLQYLQRHQPQTTGLFLHVPPLTATNRALILEDVTQLLRCLV
ncbi:peptidase C15 [Synechococcus moorigangaii CMS01]|nr:peptidase C15 [Synechococcus moorigangaii CMS01]